MDLPQETLPIWQEALQIYGRKGDVKKVASASIEVVILLIWLARYPEADRPRSSGGDR